MGIETIIEELSTDPKYSHAVFGCFGGTSGHYVQETKGPYQIKETIWSLRSGKIEKEYSEMFEYGVQTSGPEFEARLHGESIQEGFKLVLTYNDRHGDSRGCSHTDYLIVIPKSETSRIIPIMKSHPHAIIKIFQNVFPSYDRSNDTLTIDPSKPGCIKIQT